jgi:hypothetical protein
VLTFRLKAEYITMSRAVDSVSQIHESLYFNDGNIVLQAKGTSGKDVIFRVHQSVLSKNCPVFQDMLALPADGVNEIYDGVPLVRMPDSAEDLQSLLNVLYDPS